MINLYNYDIFANNESTLKETSKDDADKNAITYMTDSNIKVIDFDGVKDEYIANLSLRDTPKSNDVLYKHNDELYFIEFKNGNMDKEIYNIRRKIFDSLLIFTDIINRGISFTRKYVKYILVFNLENSKNYIVDILKKDEVQDSKSFDKILDSFGSLANIDSFDFFGLRKQFKNLYFNDVYTYTSKEFDEKFIKQITSGQVF